MNEQQTCLMTNQPSVPVFSSSSWLSQFTKSPESKTLEAGPFHTNSTSCTTTVPIQSRFHHFCGNSIYASSLAITTMSFISRVAISGHSTQRLGKHFACMILLLLITTQPIAASRSLNFLPSPDQCPKSLKVA